MLGGFFPFLSQPLTRQGTLDLIIQGRIDLNAEGFRNVSRLAKDFLFRMLHVDEQ
jgi:hypothetical protein